MSDRILKQNTKEKVKQIILSQLKSGRKYRLELHHEVCRQLGYEPRPLLKKGKVSQTCKGLTDSTFDAPLNELRHGKIVKWYRGNREDGHAVMFYELTESI
jgi:hypothetical protein